MALAAALAPFLLEGWRGRQRQPWESSALPLAVLELDRDAVAQRRAGPRELRRLPGIGRVRALALARARWVRGGSFALEDWSAVPGIGAVTREGVRAWLAGNP